eukprot:CAMPEP_0115499948 /NCGR_PEP_ID=MMETSP0271-20121206/67611_1 /TAXON_ID=71861 /ORGANISM="Scrippsiella trochoidea, Strain CCMP3099" /LENGTH=46 /DNA_ID= /DNA_START= /DNA_END= /DNA_ORIENTATION=
MTIPNVLHAAVGRTTRPGRIVMGADVVLVVMAWRMRIPSIRVCDEV